MMERSFLLFICSVVLNIVLTVCLIFTCIGKKQIIETLPVETAEEIPEETEINAEEAEIIQGENVQRTSSQVSYYSARSSSGLAGIKGRVNTGEINPVNFENPDINVLKQMGAEQYIIHYFTGEQFYKSGNYDKAITEYTTAININRSFTEAYISRGNTWLKKKEYGGAVEDFSRAIRLDSNKAELYNYRGFARMELAARGSGEYSRAIEDFSQAISLKPNYVDALINRSYTYYQIRNYDKTIEDCTRIINLEPANAFIWNRRGSAFYCKGDDDKAISDFTEAIRLKRDYAVAFQNRGNAWQSKGDIEKANADYAAARQLR